MQHNVGQLVESLAAELLSTPTLLGGEQSAELLRFLHAFVVPDVYVVPVCMCVSDYNLI